MRTTESFIGTMKSFLCRSYLHTFIGRAAQLGVALAVLLALFAIQVNPASAVGATVTVNSTGDSDTRDSVITLREAIMLAGGSLDVSVLTAGECAQVSNNTYAPPCSTTDTLGEGSSDTIDFDGTLVFLPSAPATISLSSALPQLLDGETINAVEAGVRVDGVTETFDCFTVSGAGSSITGIEEITNCATAAVVTGGSNTIGGTNVGEGVCTGSVDNDSDGFVNDGCPQSGATAEQGANCSNSTDDDLADLDGAVNDGCPPRGQGIVINGNGTYGISVDGANGTSIRGNYIGTDVAGVSAIANGVHGIRVSASSNTTIGGTLTDGNGNIISGNGDSGIMVSGASTGSTIKGNRIGLSAAGGNLGNTQIGVWINAASGNTVGGSTTPGSCTLDCNVISGNGNDGVALGSSATGNFVKGNFIGVNLDATSSIPNSSGVGIVGDSNVIGGTTAAERNVISGNTFNGVFIGTFSPENNVVLGNYIGTNAAGTAARSNGGAGVLITSTGSTTGNTIGGVAAGAGNVISGNSGAGVTISGAGASSNIVAGNYIGTNAAGTAAVANGGDGVRIESGGTGNTVGGSTGGDRNVISGNTQNGVKITGTASSNNTVKGNYIGTNAAGTGAVPNFNGVVIEPNGTGNTVGGGAAGDRNVISGNTRYGVALTGFPTTGHTVKGNYIGTDAAGSADLGNGWDGVQISADAAGNTIGGSAAGDRNVISGNNSDGIEINGASTSGNLVLGNYIGTNAGGTAPIGNSNVGVHVTAPGNTVGGLTGTPGAPPGNVISGNVQGVMIYGESADSNVVQGNLIGTTAGGTGSLGNSDVGVWTLSGADSNVVGGSSTPARNVISSNGRGVAVFDAGTTLNEIRGNYIGTDITGTADLGNNQGVALAYGSSNTTVGGTTAAERNVISGNLDGIVIGEVGISSTGNTIKGNYIGTDAGGTSSLGNTNNGIRITAASDNNAIGGTGGGDGNVIAYNGQDGVHTSSGTGNAVRGNSLHSNGQLAIDLFDAGDVGPGVTPNDVGDGDTGPNNLMNFPVITSVSWEPGPHVLFIGGTVDDTSASVDVYVTDSIDGSGNGEGRVWLGPATNIGGSWVLSPPTVPPYGYISVTATDSSGNTSEFSATFDADVDGDGLVSSVDNCDVVYNAVQLDNDGDGVGDVCDSVVRNRYSASSSSLVSALSTAPGQQMQDDGRFSDPWDYNAGMGIDTGALVGTLEVSVNLGGISTPCDQGNYYNVSLINATTSMATLVNTSSILADADADGLVNGVEQFPRFLTTLLDPERLTNVDDDADGAIDEDGPDGTDNDSDTRIDEDVAGTPRALHARYFGQIGGGFIQVLIFEITPNVSYERWVIFNDPIGPYFVATDVCSPLEYKQTVNNNSADNPATTAIEGVAPVLGSVSAGTHVFRYERTDPPDTDGDGVVNYLDNCAALSNAGQADTDGDKIGDGCDTTPAVNTNSGDHDGDGYYNVVDNCPTIPNASQLESERRTAAPFGQYHVGDAMGDVCDRNPTLVTDPAEISPTTYSDAICVTGGGITDADLDGWCGGAATDDPNDASAAVTPEDDSIAPGSCLNGVDDDGDTARDANDNACADGDGDGVPDTVDVCPRAADPLQLDGDGDGQGDACEDENIVTLAATVTTGGANAELRHRLVEVAPGKLHRNNGIIKFADQDWGITAGSSVPDGAIRSVLSSMITAGIDPDPAAPSTTWKPCNNVFPVGYSLLDASTNPGSTIDPGAGLSNLVADSDADELPNGLESYPSFLLSIRDASSRVDNDGDSARDEDPTDGFDNDQDGAVDEDPYDHIAPLARLFGSTRFQNANHTVNVLVYSPGSLPLYPASMGYMIMFVFDDPTRASLNGNVTDLCTHQDHRLYEYAVSLDNPSTAANEGGAKVMNNDTDGFMGSDPEPTEKFLTQVTTLPDLDGDGIENFLDVCVSDPDNDDDGTNDSVDATPWNPRLVAPPGDGDLDGYPKACDPNDSVPSPPGSGPDDDADHVANTADNCPGSYNPDQADSDADGIGDVCDADPRLPSGIAQTVVNGTPVCTQGTDADKDGYCAGLDPDDTTGSNLIVPEASAYAPQVCVDEDDNDLDTYIDLDPLETGCVDLDIDTVPNELDNCPGIPPAIGANNYNPNQLDSDNDGQVGQQPFARSATDVPEGDPATVLGSPFARSDRFGGDVCDPDDDNDGLPDGNEPTGCVTRPDCDSDLLLDLWEYGRTCLSITVANQAKANADGDDLFNYGEGAIGTDPCTANSGDSFSQDTDGDGYKAAHERYIIALSSTYVPQSYDDRCGAGANPAPSIAWPSDLASGGIPDSTDKLTVRDLTTFLAPARRLDTSPGNLNFNRRWDIVPGPGLFNNWIVVTDLTALISGPIGFPPMYAGVGTGRAYGSSTPCTLLPP